jgi:ribonuclease D
MFGQQIIPLEFSYKKVEDQKSLMECLDDLKDAKEIALDLEFDRDRFAYGFTLCLIQVSDGKMSWLIDPFAKLDLSPLYRFFEQEVPLKIMHSPSEDLTLLHQQGCFPVNIFDTERTARLLDFEAFSLGNLLLNCLEIQLDKSQQRTDWTKRPLKDQQWVYAARDVLFLPELKKVLLEKALQRGVLDFVKEENTAWNHYRVEEKRQGWFVNKDDERKLPPFYLHIYNEMMGLRDSLARKLNKPGFQVAPREVLMDVTFHPEFFDKWKDLEGLHPALRNRESMEAYRAAWIKGQAEADAQKLSKRSASSGLAPAEREKLAHERKRLAAVVDEKYRPVLEKIAEQYGKFTASYILNEKTMTELASGRLKLESLPYIYRQELIISIAKELGISLP